MAINIKYISVYLIALLSIISVSFAFSADLLNQEKTLTTTAISEPISKDVAVTETKNTEHVYPIKLQIVLLKKLSEHDSGSAQLKLTTLYQSGIEFNKAEQYLLYLTQANIDNAQEQKSQAISWINKALDLEPFLNKKQLVSPEFAGAYLLLANIYQQQGNYQAAYDNKEKYIEKHFDYLTLQTELRVKRLSEKYKIAKMNEENKLLEQSSKLKHFELKRIESHHNQQNINIVIICLASVLLFFLLYRQFKIRHTLRVMAKMDSLTKLANRKAFFAQGERYMEQARKAKSELCVLMLDIDHLKSINDTLGDDVGDKVICHVARLASETMRARDVLARIAGEEFSAILPDANVDQAKAIAERIREKIESSIDKELKHFNVTVSIGLASIQKVQTSFDELLYAADLAMYKAKANGCNSVCTYMSSDQ